MDNRNIKIFVVVLALFLVSTSIVTAFGISAPYWNSNPLKMFPGQTKEVSFNLQNCAGLLEGCDKSDEDIVVALEEGSEIARITSGEKYTIPYGTADQFVKLIIEIPSDAKLGDKYTVRFSSTALPDVEGGTVQIGIKYDVDFPVIVAGESEVPPEITPTVPPVTDQAPGTNLTTIIVSIIVIIIILIIAIAWIVKKNK